MPTIGDATMLKAFDTIARRPAAIGVVLAIGCLLRLAHYTYNRALWRDEASLWKSIAYLDWSDLAGPLYNDEESPLGFLFVQKAIAAVLGDSELSLRALSLVAGLIGLILFWRLSRRLLGPAGQLLAVLLFAVAYSPVYYSAELKPYSVELALATALQLVALKGIDEDRPGRTAAILAVAGAVSLWFSFQAIFVLAGSAWTFLLLAWSQRDRRWLWAGIVPGLAWVLSLTGFFLVSLSRILENQPMLAAWTQHFWPVVPTSVAQALWLPRHAYLLFRAPGDLPVASACVAFALFGAGVWSLWRARDLRLSLLLLPILLPLIPSAIQAYPYHGRHLLFTLPALLVLIVRGLEWLAHFERPAARRASAFLAVVLGASGIWTLVRRFPERLHREEVRPLMVRLERETAGGTLYVYHGARKSFEYYSRRYNLNRLKAIQVGTQEPDDVLRLKGAGTVWVLVIRVPDRRFDNWSVFAARLETVGACAPYDQVTAADRTIEKAVGLYRCSL